MRPVLGVDAEAVSGPEGYSVKDTRRVLQKARRLAEKHGRLQLADELTELLADVRTAAQELDRMVAAERREIDAGWREIDRIRAQLRGVERDALIHEAQNEALLVMLDQRDWFPRLLQQGFSIETLDPALRRKKRRDPIEEDDQ